MTVARSVADVLTDHVKFEVECIDRMYLNVYVPTLQYPLGLVGFVHRQLELPVASTAPLGKISDRFTREIHRFAEIHDVPWVKRVAGYRYDISIRQCEFSLTQMLDKPVTGRIFFEQVIRDNLDAGRPDQVSLIFDRR